MPATLVSARHPHPGAAALPLAKDGAPDAAAGPGSPLVARLRALHQKASRALILGQSETAWRLSCEAVQHCNIERLTCEYGEQQARQLCCRLWILHICVLSSMAELAEEDGRLRVRRDVASAPPAGFPTSVRDVWDSIMAAFGSYAGNVDSEVLVPTVLLCLKLRDARTARDIVEAWLATLSDETMFLLQSGDDGGIGGAARLQQRTMAKASYLRVCELYTLHILPQLGDFPSAYDFLSLSTVVSDPARNEFTKRLDSLRNLTAAPRKPSKRSSKRRPAKPAPLEERTVLSLPAAAAPLGGRPVRGPVRAGAKGAATAAGVLPPPDKHGAAVAAADGAARGQPRAESRALLGLAPLPPKGASIQPALKTHAVVRKPRGVAGIAWQVARRLMSRWGFTLFTLAIAAAVIRLLTQRFRLPQLLAVVYRKLWSTAKMGTQVTYI
ncbi:hypothetical protein LPJ61_005128 [Coemansia biformis]|uniref:Uncharacterized protein n=1 Tax=Coemansia biformis TaxID=1286918 RepID=A0A9W7Y9F5_9FUNG|nr:hypothetical protein LPJ61_005128 [Coemansia biformis]